jgi:hypothetical protein
MLMYTASFCCLMSLTFVTVWLCGRQLPPVIAAILRVAVVSAPIIGRAFMDAYKQAMISEFN